MVRTYFTALATLLALLSSNVLYAFGLGEITLKSYLNQPFDAEIEILDKGDLTRGEIIPKLATPKDFANVGLQRNFFLTRLNFKVVFGEDRDYVHITSREPVTEPYLDFLVEFLWPEGRLLREYTVLLDPPSYAAQFEQEYTPVIQTESAEPPAETQAVNQQTEQNQTAQAVSSSSASSESTPENSASSSTISDDSTRRTASNANGETLWSIASREKPSEDVSVQQMMLAIKKLNPDSFEHDNINYLKKNQVLRLPNEQEIRALATREAMGIVADENREWAGRTVAEGGTLPSNTAKLVGSRQVTPMEEGAQAGDQMKLVAQSGEQGDSIGASSGEGSGLSDEGARVNRQVQQLQSQNSQLQSQVETSERLISLKDQQIAELQARLAEQGADTSTTIDDEVDNVIERVAVDSSIPASDELESEDFEPAAEEAEEKDVDMVMSEEDEIAAALAEAQSDAAMAEDEIAQGEMTEDDMSFEADENAQAELATSSSESEASSTLASSSGSASVSTKESKGILDNPFVLPGVGVLVLLLLGGLGFFLYKKRVNSSGAEATPDFSGIDEDEGFPEGFGEESADIDDDFFGGAEENAEADLLSEANAYLANERWDRAIENLQKLIEEGDESREVQFKLLEAYAGAGDKQNFKALRSDILTESPELESEVDQIGASLEASGAAAPDMDATTRMDASDFDLDSNEEEFDISLDDLANDLDASFAGGEDKSETFEDESSSDDLAELEGVLDLSDDLEALESSEPEAQSESADDELELDLDLDFDDEDEAETESTEEDSGLDLDLGDTVVLENEEQTDNASEDDDGLELDLDDLGFDEEEPEAESTQEDDSLDLEASLDLSDEAEDDSLDLSFDEDLSIDSDDDAIDLSTENETGDDELLDLGDTDDDFDLDSALDLEGDAVTKDDSGNAEDNSDDELNLDDEDSDDGFELDLDDEDLDAGLDLSLDDDEHASASEVETGAEEKSVDSLFDSSDDDDFDLPDEGDEAATKLDLARAYIDMGDEDGAKDILEEVISEGDDQQKAEAKALLEKI